MGTIVYVVGGYIICCGYLLPIPFESPRKSPIMRVYIVGVTLYIVCIYCGNHRICCGYMLWEISTVYVVCISCGNHSMLWVHVPHKIYPHNIPLKTHHYPVPGRDDIRRIKQWKYVVVGVNYGLEHNNMTFK